jgi:hypothetical protein
MDPDEDVANKFNHREVANDQRAVRLLGRKPADGCLIIDRKAVEMVGPDKFDRSATPCGRRAIAETLDNSPCHGFDRKAVRQKADAPALPNASERQLLAQYIGWRVVPLDG